MATHEIVKEFSNAGSRNDVRMRVVEEFSKEEPGLGRDNLASKYVYFVEQLRSGQRIFLSRPAFMHNGFDFVVRVEGMNFANVGKRRRDAPSHDDIINDLTDKRAENIEEYAKLYHLIKEVYECHDISCERIDEIHLTVGLLPELLLKVLKWLFIEQEIRYWNYSGRDMLWSGIPKPNDSESI